MLTEVNSAVQSLLDELVASGHELGLQVAAYHKGQLVVDAWSGVANPEGTRPVDGDTLFPVQSTTKGIVATCIHLLAEWGELDYDSPVARYWPDFAAPGKDAVTVRHVLSHQAGLPDDPRELGSRAWSDWDAVVARIAEMPLAWAPGTRTVYHSLTYGWILGEVVRRIFEYPIDAVVQDYICAPLGMQDIYLGIPESVADRVAVLVDATHPAATPIYCLPHVLRAVIPGAGGVMSARALARHYAALVSAVDGVRLLPPARIRAATEVQTSEHDPKWGFAVRRGLGYLLGGPLPPRDTGQTGLSYDITYGVMTALAPMPSSFGHGGAGGSLGFADSASTLAIGFTKTSIASPLDRSPDPPASRIATTIRQALGLSESR